MENLNETLNIRKPQEKVKITKDLLINQINFCKEEIHKQLGVIAYCNNLLQVADLEESKKGE